MKRQPRILAGTAIGLFMASAPLAAMPMIEASASDARLPLIRVQAECQEGESSESCAARLGGEQQPQAEQPQPEQQAEEPAPRRKKQRESEEAQQQQEQPAVEVAPQPDQQVEEEAPRRKKQRQAEESQQQQEQPAAEAAPEPQQQAEEPAPRRKKQRQAEEAQQQEQPAVEVAPEPQQQAEEPAPRRKKRQTEEAQQPQEQAPKEAAPVIEPQPAERPAEQAERPAEPTPEQVPAPVPAPGGEAPEQAQQPAEQPLPTEQQPEQAEQPAPQAEQPVQQGEAPANPNEAPILDSQKETPAPSEAVAQPPAGEQPAEQARPAQPSSEGQQAVREQPAPVDLGPPPVDDKTAQEAARPLEIKPVTAERGTRLERAPVVDLRQRPRPQGTEFVREIGDRVIIEVNNQIFVESNDRPRLTRNAQDVYYEELPGGRTREVILRDNGNQVITVRNRFGDIVHRSRITPDGREYVLSYVDDRYYEEVGEWRDPGYDLPPLQLHIPRNQYILEAEYAEDPDAYYDFLEQPPVERVKRLYSVDEVKRSARVRDIARRIDLDTLNFEFGSASIGESEVEKLEGVANAMDRLLQKNPAETFLIEGHTDAVGSDVANLALSDRRAEAVADALTNVFGIPPENLSTQGYGERYLKVKTQVRERENRRVAIRRITPLVAPVASAD